MSAPDLLTAGEALVSLRSDDAATTGGGAWRAHVAGAEANVAIGMARLGHRAQWVGAVGADDFGRLVHRELRAEDVDVTGVVVDAQRPTGLMFVARRTADLARVDYRRGGSAGSILPREAVEPALARGPRLVHITGITPALSPESRDTAGWLVESASAAGAFVSLDVNYRARLWTRAEAREALEPLTRHTKLVVASEDELDLVAGAGTQEAAVGVLLDRGVEQVVVKRGSGGATVWTSDGRVDAPALAVTAVDTIGAGDAFTAGYLSGVADGLPVAERLRRGNVLGAFCVSTRGDWQGLPRREELTLLEDHERGGAVR
ncbi:MAG TPA: sugar kinase [Pedococcus sp.]|nr:sugar kinase [Pedococcus sp.]